MKFFTRLFTKNKKSHQELADELNGKVVKSIDVDIELLKSMFQNNGNRGALIVKPNTINKSLR